MYLEILLLSFIHKGSDCPLCTWRVALSKPITSPLERSPPSNHVGGEASSTVQAEPVIKVHQRKPAVGRTKEVVFTLHYRTLEVVLTRRLITTVSGQLRLPAQLTSTLLKVDLVLQHGQHVKKFYLNVYYT